MLSRDADWSRPDSRSSELRASQRMCAMCFWMDDIVVVLNFAAVCFNAGARRRQRQRLHELLDAAGPPEAAIPLSAKTHHNPQQVQQLKLLYSTAQTLPVDVLQHSAAALDPSTRRTLLSERFFLYRGWKAFQRGDLEAAEVQMCRA